MQNILYYIQNGRVNTVSKENMMHRAEKVLAGEIPAERLHLV